MPFSVDVQLVHETERKLGVKFPPAYVVRICRENGGEVCVASDSFWLYPIFDGSDRKRLKRTCNDVVRETAMSRDRPGFPQDGVAIGSNGTADRLVLLPSSIDPQHLGHEVYWWDHETDELTQVAADFSDFGGS